MKKRKPPFALVGVLVVLIGVAVVFSNRQMTSSGMQQSSPEAPIDDHANDGHSEHEDQPEAPDPTAADVGKVASSLLESGENPTPETEKMQAMAADPIMKPDLKKFVPVADNNRTATQWWKDKK